MVTHTHTHTHTHTQTQTDMRLYMSYSVGLAGRTILESRLPVPLYIYKQPKCAVQGRRAQGEETLSICV